MNKGKLPDRYIYPAVFTYYGNGEDIAVDFPDLEAATSGTDESNALLSARELLGGRLAILEEDGANIPSPSQITDIHLEDNEYVMLVDVYMPAFRMANATKSISRTVTLPAWLNAAAMEQNLNFSQVLQNALKDLVSTAQTT